MKPWIVVPTKDPIFTRAIKEEGELHTIAVVKDDAEAQMIVKSRNMHYELLEIVMTERDAQILYIKDTGGSQYDKDYLESLNAAISKAESKNLQPIITKEVI